MNKGLTAEQKEALKEVADILAAGDLFITVKDGWCIRKLRGMKKGRFVAGVENFKKGIAPTEVVFRISVV